VTYLPRIDSLQSWQVWSRRNIRLFTNLPAMQIRLARVTDRDALYDICVRTADFGNDGRHLFEDHDLPGHMWAGAYLAVEPRLAFVVADNEGVAGYVIGALDTIDFEQRCEREWWPALRDRYPNPVGIPRELRTRDQMIHRSMHKPVLTPHEHIGEHPSHLHIDLLPRAQGQGLGAAMMATLLNELRSLGSPGVHLGVSPANARAVAFYKHLGFTTLAEFGGHGLLMGMRL